MALSLHKAQEELSRLLSDLNGTRAEMEKEKATLQMEIWEFEQAIAAKKSALQNEVANLEERKAIAERPLDEKKREILSMEVRLEEQKKVLLGMAERTGEERSELVELKALLTDKESEVIQMEAVAAARLKKVQEAEEFNRKSTVDLGEKWRLFHAERQKFISEVAEKEKDLDLEKNALSKEKIWLEEQKQMLENEKKHIESKQETLRLAFEEARSKNLL